MEENKYELTEETFWFLTHNLHRIKALKDFGDVKKGDLGGWIEKESNLSQDGNCWVYYYAKVFGDAEVYGSAQVYGKAIVCRNAEIWGNAKVYDNAQVYDNAEIRGNATVSDNARVYDHVQVYGSARIYDHACVTSNAKVFDNAWAYDSAVVCGDAKVYDNAQVFDKALVSGNAKVYGNAKINGYAEICGNAEVKSINDYAVFKNFWSSGRWFTWTKSNNMWREEYFYGTGEELIKKAYKESEESGRQYKTTVKYVKRINTVKRPLLKKIIELFKEKSNNG